MIPLNLLYNEYNCLVIPSFGGLWGGQGRLLVWIRKNCSTLLPSFGGVGEVKKVFNKTTIYCSWYICHKIVLILLFLGFLMSLCPKSGSAQDFTGEGRSLNLKPKYKNKGNTSYISPNQFVGSDIDRIQKAIDFAAQSMHKMVIPGINSNGTNSWKIDRAILLPPNMTVILDNCTIQLSDQCRDNMFRSENVGVGMEHPVRIRNINIVGIGNVILKGAANPRATGDAYRVLVTDKEPKGRKSYGSDANKAGEKQRGDWRNNLIQIAMVDSFGLRNVTIENSHAWAISFERTQNAEISSIRFNNPEYININGEKFKVFNKDGINLRHGCKYFRINDISGVNGDDLIALTSLDLNSSFPSKSDTSTYFRNGDVNSYQVTSTKWNGPDDDTEQVYITNCQTNYCGVAIRASGNAGIHHVYVNGVITSARPDTPPPYRGSPYTLCVGGKGYGAPSTPGKIHHIYATNLVGDGLSLILVESPICDCQFINGIYSGNTPSAITYKIDKAETKNVIEVNLIKIPVE